MRRSRHPILTLARLNRATLARQLLLDRAELGVIAAVEQVAGLQAQEPASPYVALWTRLRSFAPADLDRAFRDREVVKATLMRVTVHAVSRRDYLHLLPALQPMLRAVRRTGADEPEIDTPALAEAALAWASVPRTNVELRDRLGEAAWWRVRRHAPFVHVPSPVPWSFGRRPTLVAAPAWLGDPFASPADAVAHVVRRHLGAFGPATRADIAAWSGSTVRHLRAGIDALVAAGEVRRFEDEAGRELLDLAGAPIPPEDVPAPPRLLPMWDSVLLAHADRTRVIADDDRAIVIARNGDVLPTFLVDGRVAGLWWTESNGGRTRIALEPFRHLAPGDRKALEDEGGRLAAFLEPLEPAAYGRYRRSRARRSSSEGAA
jgi:hypothetical protein